MLDVPAEPLRHLSRLHAAERRRRGTNDCTGQSNQHWIPP
jgi:hypothetical protein